MHRPESGGGRGHRQPAFIAAGPLLAALSVAAGATFGGVTGVLVGMGIPEIEAGLRGKLRGGNLLIGVHTENAEQQKRAEQIYKTASAADICSTT